MLYVVSDAPASIVDIKKGYRRQSGRTRYVTRAAESLKTTRKVLTFERLVD